MRRVEVVYRGRVQGVGFRATARAAAASFSVAGWVRNEPDGSVRLIAEGEPDDVDRFMAAISHRLGRYIESRHDHEMPPLGERGFEIRY